MVRTYGEPKKGYLNFTLGNLWATQPIALLIWPPLQMYTENSTFSQLITVAGSKSQVDILFQ